LIRLAWRYYRTYFGGNRRAGSHHFLVSGQLEMEKFLQTVISLPRI